MIYKACEKCGKECFVYMLVHTPQVGTAWSFCKDKECGWHKDKTRTELVGLLQHEIVHDIAFSKTDKIRFH